MSDRPDSSVTLILQGDLEGADRTNLQGRLLGAARGGVTAVVIDLSEVTAFDSSSVRAIVGARTALERRNVGLRVSGASAVVRRVLAMTGLVSIPAIRPGTTIGAWPQSVLAGSSTRRQQKGGEERPAG